ncbi:hypothetical protein X798_05043 [Onchocerca flexuosa]|uniref:Uncharacterized protein n=1 Tax=Onchocerca flexuosa TaxID=387005 RepID=A0A238BST8_9BILA|nr:hypothetical protein X798_05043 [Onchocerca flexuosa]
MTLNKQLNNLDLSQFDNDSNLKLLRNKTVEKKNDRNTMETILNAAKSEENPLLMTQKSTAPTETFRNISKRQVNNENRLTQRTALSSNLPSACSSPTEKTAKKKYAECLLSRLVEIGKFIGYCDAYKL